MKNHDYTKQFWGHAISSFDAQKDGSINMVGHGTNIRKGDTLTMNMQSGKIAKFEVKTIEYFRDPHDMWKMKTTFVGYVETPAG